MVNLSRQEHGDASGASDHTSWTAGGTTVFLLCAAFAAGYFAKEWAPAGWPFGLSTLFVALGTLCLGFGAAVLVMHMRQRSETKAIREDYERLARRSKALVAKADDFLERRRTRS